MSNEPEIKLDGLVLHIGPLMLGVKQSLHHNDMSKSEIDKFLQCVLELQAENAKLNEDLFNEYRRAENAKQEMREAQQRAEKAEVERDDLLELIYNHCIGDLAMSIPLDAQAMGESAYRITGIHAGQLRKEQDQ